MKTNILPFSDQPPGVTPDNTRVGNFYWDDFLNNGYDDGYAVLGATSFGTTDNVLRTYPRTIPSLAIVETLWSR
jgi:hypothetical protein